MEGMLTRRGKPWEYLVAIGSGLLLTVLLVVALGDVVRELIVIPLLYVLWMGRLLLRSVPQVLFWSAFLIVACFLAFGSLAQGERARPDPHPAAGSSSGQVSVWARRIHLMTRGGYTGWYFGQHMERLIVAVLAYRERLSTRETRRRMKAGELESPPEVRAYFDVAMMPSRRRWRIGLLSRFRLRPRGRAQGIPPAGRGMERVIRFLEDQLEVEHDVRNR
jgi:hypothetical protein